MGYGKNKALFSETEGKTVTEMKEPIRILHVLGTTNLGGAESRIMDLYRNIDRTKIQFDFMVHTRSEGYFEQEIKGLGGKIYRVPAFKIWNIHRYQKAWKDFFKSHREFRVVHGHMTSTASIYLPIAKKNGISLTIAHARSAGVDKGLKGKATKILRRRLSDKADQCIACSKEAAISVFGKNADVMIIPNAVKLEDFQFSTETRRKMREKLGLNEKWVLGHVGRFHYAKNHEYLIQILKEIVKVEKNVKLLLLGDGENKQVILNLVEQLGLQDYVMFMGNQRPVSDYYQAMDFFVFPSRYEGLPGTVVEAQAAGLRCVVSDCITEEVKCTELVNFKSIEDEPSAWAEEILKNRNYRRENKIEEMQKKGFDVKTQITRYYEIYGIND